jgi:crotonobetainyl-CoA:carnitine CoA-transferase CaiB-like acyl-CoA transferase
VAHALVRKADVFLSNLRRQKLVGLGMDVDTLRAVNPRLVYAGLTGYGTEGPERDRAAFDYAAFWARAGIMASLGEPEGPPPTQRPGMGDHMTGLGMAGAIAAALLARERTGRGQEIRMSLFQSGLWMLASDIQAAITTGYCHTPGGRRAAPNPLFNFYRTKDGAWLHLIMLQPDRHWVAFCRAIGRDDIATDPRFAGALVRFQHCRELIALLDPIFAERTLAEWATILDGADCYWGRVQSVEDVVDDAQAAAIGAFAERALPDGRPLRIVKSPVVFTETPAAVRGTAPELGQHTEEVLLEAGYGWDDIARLKDAGALG